MAPQFLRGIDEFVTSGTQTALMAVKGFLRRIPVSAVRAEFMDC